MNTSESISKIAAALVAAQADLRGVEKSATNPHFRSKYAPLDAIIGMVRPALAAHGCAVLQSAAQSGADAIDVTTRIVHESGEWIENEVYIPLAKRDPQGAGAAVTYGRRFGLSALLSISTDEDDDGNNASGPPRRKTAGNVSRMAPANATKVEGRTQPPATPSVPLPAKPAGEKVWKGRQLKLYTNDELIAIEERHRHDPVMSALIEAIDLVLAQRVEDVDEDARVARMKADDNGSDGLPF